MLLIWIGTLWYFSQGYTLNIWWDSFVMTTTRGVSLSTLKLLISIQVETYWRGKACWCSWSCNCLDNGAVLVSTRLILWWEEPGRRGIQIFNCLLRCDIRHTRFRFITFMSAYLQTFCQYTLKTTLYYTFSMLTVFLLWKPFLLKGPLN